MMQLPVTRIDASQFDELDPRKYILIKGARVNNLKSVDVAIPRNKLVVITGLSGSGKSSLAFDTLFAEGQRMYVESLSSYARQFLGRMEKPEVEYIKGISPAIAIEQKVNTRNPRSTVGTSTEIYDYLKLLFARIGHTFSPVSGQLVRKDSVTDVVNFILNHEEGARVLILTTLLVRDGRSIYEELTILLSKGYNRIMIGTDVAYIEEILEKPEDFPLEGKEIYILIDRATVHKDDEDTQYRLSDSVQTAFFEGEGICYVQVVNGEQKTFSDKFELDGIIFEEPTVNLFSFNNPFGACKRCEGFGKVLGIDPELVIPDKNLSVYDGAIAPWRTEKMSEWLVPLVRNGAKFDFPIHRPYKELTAEQKELLWTGNQYFQGINSFVAELETQTYKIQYRVLLSRFRGRTTCPDCRGSRLRKDASYVKVGGVSITDLVLMPINNVIEFFKSVDINEHDRSIAKRILTEIETRLDYMNRVGLGYLTLNRLTNSLSGGEFQRIKLATSLGSALVGSMYILDEPSIGLHPRDTQRLVGVLESLRDLGNTVIVVEHEEEVMHAADQIIDIGPEAGTGGGNLVFQGNWDEIRELKLSGEENSLNSHTLDFLLGHDSIPVPTVRRKSLHFLEIKGARENNLKDVDVKIPLNNLTVVTGVSGSGKSTLIRKILYPALMRLKGEFSEEVGKYNELSGSLDRVEAIEMIDQNPIGKSSRSNPVTYIKAYDYIRQMMSDLPISKARSYKPSHFSFNVDGGRCEICQGEGQVKV
ncbi:MAG: excinuclease ABC subunit UvrA, partial [Dyadobacter sp.]